jgi:hypothetical protein
VHGHAAAASAAAAVLHDPLLRAAPLREVTITVMLLLLLQWIIPAQGRTIA